MCFVDRDALPVCSYNKKGKGYWISLLSLRAAIKCWISSSTAWSLHGHRDFWRSNSCMETQAMNRDFNVALSLNPNRPAISA